MKKTTKKLALEAILFSMESIRENIEASFSPEDVTANTLAMKALAEAFEKVKGA